MIETGEDLKIFERKIEFSRIIYLTAWGYFEDFSFMKMTYE
jgi:hypothetical protein